MSSTVINFQDVSSSGLYHRRLHAITTGVADGSSFRTETSGVAHDMTDVGVEPQGFNMLHPMGFPVSRIASWTLQLRGWASRGVIQQLNHGESHGDLMI